MAGNEQLAGGNLFERRLQQVVPRAIQALSHTGPKFPLRVANDLLTFFVTHSPNIPEISERYFHRLMDSARAHPDTWRERAREDFIANARRMVVPPVPVITPKPRTGDQAVNRIIHGDFLTEARQVPEQSVDLVLTSPPYAMQRASSYGGIPEDQYPAFTSLWMTEARRILKPKGNVAIVIRPHVKDGRVASYVRHTLDWLEQDGWNYCDEWAWVKEDAPPLGHNQRPRRAWESVHWFSLDKQPYCAPKAAGRPSKRLGMSGGAPHKVGTARASDVILANVNGIDGSPFNTHTAQFPTLLAETLIAMLCPPRGVVLDPFIGSGTTAVAAKALSRSCIGFEKHGGYVNIARKRIKTKGATS